jgi:hypothetical protein
MNLQTIAYAQPGGTLRTIPAICTSSTSEAQFLDSAASPLICRIKPGVLTNKTFVVRLRGDITAGNSLTATFRLYFGKTTIALGTVIGSAAAALNAGWAGEFDISWTLRINDAQQFLSGEVRGNIASVIVPDTAVTLLNVANLLVPTVAGSSGYVVAANNPTAQISTPAGSTSNSDVYFVASGQTNTSNAGNLVQLVEFSVETN